MERKRSGPLGGFVRVKERHGVGGRIPYGTFKRIADGMAKKLCACATAFSFKLGKGYEPEVHLQSIKEVLKRRFQRVTGRTDVSSNVRYYFSRLKGAFMASRRMWRRRKFAREVSKSRKAEFRKKDMSVKQKAVLLLRVRHLLRRKVKFSSKNAAVKKAEVFTKRRRVRLSAAIRRKMCNEVVVWKREGGERKKRKKRQARLLTSRGKVKIGVIVHNVNGSKGVENQTIVPSDLVRNRFPLRVFSETRSATARNVVSGSRSDSVFQKRSTGESKGGGVGVVSIHPYVRLARRKQKVR
jgi:hypothetical protein